MSETDPGSTGTKLSKSGVEVDARLLARNKSYNKVLDYQSEYIRAAQAKVENIEEFRTRWLKKSQWHESEYGF